MEDIFGDRLKDLLNSFADNSIQISKKALYDYLNELEKTEMPEPSFKKAVILAKTTIASTNSPLESMATLLMAAGMVQCYAKELGMSANVQDDRFSIMILAGAMAEACNVHLDLERQELN